MHGSKIGISGRSNGYRLCGQAASRADNSIRGQFRSLLSVPHSSPLVETRRGPVRQPRPNQALRLDLCESRLGLSLSIQQPSCEPFFRWLHKGKQIPVLDPLTPVVRDEYRLTQQMLLRGRYHHRSAGVCGHVQSLDV
jgi:hypothetical protein